MPDPSKARDPSKTRDRILKLLRFAEKHSGVTPAERDAALSELARMKVKFPEIWESIKERARPRPGPLNLRLRVDRKKGGGINIGVVTEDGRDLTAIDLIQLMVKFNQRGE